MGMKELRKGIGIVETVPQKRFLGPRDEVLISKAEEYLGFKFPPSYREFLRVLGSGFVRGHEFYGIVDEHFSKSGIPDAIWLTMNERKSGWIPDTLLLIAQSYEGYFAIDVSQKDAFGESPIVDWNPGKGKGPYEKEYEDFGVFFLEKVGRYSA